MRCIMHGQTAAAAPQIVEYVKESFPQYAVWEVCDAPKNDTLLHKTNTWVQISVENGKIVATQSSGNADRACYVNLLA